MCHKSRETSWWILNPFLGFVVSELLPQNAVSLCGVSNLICCFQVIDDPDNDKIYMVLEYEEKGPVFEGTGPAGGIGVDQARAFICDAIVGLQYLHYHNIVHGDIKPDNLMVSNGVKAE